MPTTAPEAHGGSTGARSPYAEPVRRSLRQWVVLGVIVVLMSTTCVFLGRWQWHRHEARQAEIAQIEDNYNAEPVAFDTLLSTTHPMSPADVWRPITVAGHYLVDATALLRNRPWSDGAGFHVLVPFETDTGTMLIIDRGFITGLDAPEVGQIAAPATGPVQVTVRLRLDEPASTRGTVGNQVYAINTAQVLTAGGLDPRSPATTGAYGVLVSEVPAAAANLIALPVPDTDPRSHLSYAFQWWVFAAGMVVMFVIVVRREQRGRRVTLDDILTTVTSSGDEPGPNRPAWGGGSRTRDRHADETDEDSQIETQLRR